MPKKNASTKKSTSKKDPEPALSDIVSELKVAGKLIKDNLEKAWKSEQRQQAEAQIAHGIGTFVRGLDMLVKKAKKKQLEKTVKKDVFKHLKNLNSVLVEKSKIWKKTK